MKAESTVNRQMKQLRKLIETTDDEALKRVAYAMETAVTWAREDTVGWPSLVDEAQAQAQCLKDDLK